MIICIMVIQMIYDADFLNIILVKLDLPKVEDRSNYVITKPILVNMMLGLENIR